MSRAYQCLLSCDVLSHIFRNTAGSRHVRTSKTVLMQVAIRPLNAGGVSPNRPAGGFFRASRCLGVIWGFFGRRSEPM